jgi:hypothetical protein
MMAKKCVWCIALLAAMCMLACSGSEYRFGNTQTYIPKSLSGQWSFSAQSQTIPANYNGTGTITQTNEALLGNVNLLFDYCAPTAGLSGLIDNSSCVATGCNVTLTLQENVVGGGSQVVNLTGTVNITGNGLSGTYTAPAGSCTTGDKGVWAASKN